MTDNATLSSVQVSGFHIILRMKLNSIAIPADNLHAGVQDAHAEHSRDSITCVNKAWHL